MNSLERRFVVGLAVTLLAAFGVLFWVSVTAVRTLSEAYLLTRIEHDAEALLGVIGSNPHGQLRMREGRITPIYQQPLSGHYFAVHLADGQQIRSRSLWDEGLDVTPAAVGEVRVTQHAGPAGQWLLQRTAGYEKDGLMFTLAVAEDLTLMQREIARFQVMVLAVLGVALLLIVAVQRLLLRQGFRSLDRVRDELHHIAAGHRQRLEAMGPVEIQPLTGEVNRLLDRMQQRLDRSRRALGNLAHALKTPLSLATRDLDALSLPPAGRDRIAGQLRRVHELVERELKRARFAGDGAGQRFVPAAQVPDLLDALRQLYRDRALAIELAAALPDGSLPFDHEDMLELLGNLLDNACKWAAHRIVLELRLDRQGLTLRIADDGPGVDGADTRLLMRRGTRLDEQEPGHGLGLAIVRDLVDGYGGSLELTRSAGLGGLEVLVQLPVPAGVTPST